MFDEMIGVLVTGTPLPSLTIYQKRFLDKVILRSRMSKNAPFKSTRYLYCTNLDQ
jgi:hypothetical protein